MTTRRSTALDVLRGIAVLGTLATNIWIFTDVEGLVGYIVGERRATGAWEPVQVVLQQLAQGKFLGLLTVMFGIGLAIQQRSALRRAARWPGAYPVRAGLLFVDGVINYVLFTEFDVLMGYAVTGLVVAYILSASIRRQRLAAAVACGVHALILGVVVLALATASATPPGSALSPNPYRDGSFLDLVAFRLDNVLLFRLEIVFILPMSIALFLAGAALFRAGILEPTARRLRRRLMIGGLGVALPLDLLVGSFGGSAGLVLGRYGIAPFVALGILAAVAEFYSNGRAAGVVGRALAPVGRTALSCYVLQNALAGALCYGWGLGIAGRLDGTTVVPVTVGLFLLVAAAMTIASRLWLARFDRGPLEWVWHASYESLTRSRVSAASRS